MQNLATTLNDTKFSSLANLQPKQIEAIETLLLPECKYLLYGGAAGGGKSRFLRWAPIYYGMYMYAKYGIKHLPIGLFSEDYPTLRDRQIIKIAEEMPSWLGDIKETQKEGLVFKAKEEFGGFVIMLRNLDDPSKYSSVEFAAIFVEELTKNVRRTFDSLRSRLRYPGIGEVKFVGATNPGEVGHGWVKSLWISPDPSNLDDEHDRFYFVPATVYDNKYVSPEYIKQLQSLPEDRRRALLEGDWDMFEGQYFTEFRRDLHVLPQFDPDYDNDDYYFVSGTDWGRSPGYFVNLPTLVYEENYHGSHFYRAVTYQEISGQDKKPSEWSAEIRRRVPIAKFRWHRGDPAMFKETEDGSVSIADQFGAAGLTIQPADNARISGWEAMHRWLSLAPDGKPYWMVTDNCYNLIRTIPELVHDDVKVEDVNTHGDDHWADAARYMLIHLKWIDGQTGSVRTGKTEYGKRTKYRPMRDPAKTLDINNKGWFKEPSRSRSWYN